MPLCSKPVLYLQYHTVLVSPTQGHWFLEREFRVNNNSSWPTLNFFPIFLFGVVLSEKGMHQAILGNGVYYNTLSLNFQTDCKVRRYREQDPRYV